MPTVSNTRTWVAILVVGLLIPFGLPETAAANSKVVEDADDIDGALDILSVGHGHHEGRLMHRMTMHESWDNSILSNDGSIYFTFYFLHGNHKAINIDVSADGTLYAEIIRWDGETVLGYAKVWRPDERTVQIEFPKRALKRRLARYTWNANTVSKGPPGSSCDGEEFLCGDSVPDGAGNTHAQPKNIVHRLR